MCTSFFSYATQDLLSQNIENGYMPAWKTIISATNILTTAKSTIRFLKRLGISSKWIFMTLVVRLEEQLPREVAAREFL
jgi:hypothetical protein